MKHFANFLISKMCEAPEGEHAQWVNVWRVLAPLRTHCLAEATFECAISLRGRFTTGMQDLVDTHLLSKCMTLHSNVPPVQHRAKGQGVAVARHFAAHAQFDVRPWHRVSR